MVLGNNRLGGPVVDVSEGAGFDGLGATEVNKNRGAESTMAAHRCWSTYQWALYALVAVDRISGRDHVHA